MMQPSCALLPATSCPKTVGGMCYAIIELTQIGLKQPLVTSQSQARKLDTLSQHAVAQSWAKEARHAIPACKVQTSYPSMQLPSQRPGKLHMLSQYA